MPRYVAFLRGVSPANAKMPELKRCFQEAGFSNVRTVLSSGNVAFDARSTSEAALERRAEASMQDLLGRAFYTIVRQADSLRDLLETDPYAVFALPANAKRVVSFMREPKGTMLSLPIESDGAQILSMVGREVLTAYVLSKKGPVFMALIEKTFGTEVATRTWETVRKCAIAGTTAQRPARPNSNVGRHRIHILSNPPNMRRRDKEMSVSRAHELLASAYCGCLATVGSDGAPYICPLLFVWVDGKIWLHNTSAVGHLQRNVRHESRVCFEIDTPGETYAYGRFLCDTGLAYQSVVVFGKLAIVEERDQKTRFFDLLMSKYYAQDTDRPKGFYPLLDDVTVYSITVDRVTGKETTLPAIEVRWPAVDKTQSPNAVPPRSNK